MREVSDSTRLRNSSVESFAASSKPTLFTNSSALLPDLARPELQAYDSTSTYYFFDAQTDEVRQSLGLRRDKDYLCAFGLKVVLIAELRASRDDSLTDGQTFFKSEIERLQERVAEFELEKTNDSRSLKAFLMAKE